MARRDLHVQAELHVRREVKTLDDSHVAKDLPRVIRMRSSGGAEEAHLEDDVGDRSAGKEVPSDELGNHVQAQRRVGCAKVSASP